MGPEHSNIYRSTPHRPHQQREGRGVRYVTGRATHPRVRQPRSHGPDVGCGQSSRAGPGREGGKSLPSRSSQLILCSRLVRFFETPTPTLTPILAVRRGVWRYPTVDGPSERDHPLYSSGPTRVFALVEAEKLLAPSAGFEAAHMAPEAAVRSQRVR